MEMLEHLKNRRSIRRFLPKVIEKEKIEKIIQAACLSPSSKNTQPWEFFIVKNKQKIQALSKTQPYSAFLKTAPLVIVVVVDQKKSPGHFLEDGAIAAFSILLEASDLGLGACWNAVYHSSEKREDYVREILNAPQNYRIICNIGIGYPDEKPGKKIVKSFDNAVEMIG